MILHTYKSLKPDMSWSGVGINTKGGFKPGVPIFLGGAAKTSDSVEKKELDHGKILFTSDSLFPDIREEQKIKPGTLTERVSDVGGFKRARPKYSKSYVDLSELDHGKILYVYPDIPVDLSQEMQVNVIGKRENERFNNDKGGFIPFLHSKSPYVL